jgi:hypothetical protein
MVLETTLNFKAYDRLDQVLQTYAEAAQHGMRSAMLNTGRKLAFSLHAETKKIAPTVADIRGAARALGWFSSGRKHRRSPYPTVNTPKIRRQMVRWGGPAEVVNQRINHIGFHAVGWLPAIQGFKGVPANQLQKPTRGGHYHDLHFSHDALTKLGFIKFTSDDRELVIRMGNDAGAIEDVTRKHNLLNKAIDAVKQDMQSYIQSHLGAAAAITFGRI